MKGHKAHHHGRKHHAAGGEAHGDAAKGRAEWAEDERDNPEMRNIAPKIAHEAEERKRGGRMKRKAGGAAMKHLGKVEGHAGEHHAGRKPRKSGGRAGSNNNPLSSAHVGTLPPHHKDARID